MSYLLDTALDALQHHLNSPVLWLVIFVLAAANALVPFLPSRTAVVSAAVLARAHPGWLALLVVLAAGGALAGDCLGYWVGRRAGPGMLSRLLRGKRAHRLYEWTRGATRRHERLLIIAGRHLPGGRTFSALAPGSLGCPWRRFVVLDAAGTSIWAVYCTAIGFLGGAGFAGHPMIGLLMGFGISLVLPGLSELTRRTWAARKKAPAAAT